MPVDNIHPLYAKFLSSWEKVRIAIEGEDAIKAAGIKFLPKLGGQDETEYLSYKNRAMYYSASSRTVMGLSGAVMRKPPSISFPKAKEEMLKSISRSNKSIEAMLKDTTDEVISIGRIGHLVDAEARKKGKGVESSVPYIVPYFAENIINWEVGTVKGRRVPVLIVLRETVSERTADDIFELKEELQFRVLLLMNLPDEEEPTYVQQIWVKAPADSKEKWILDKTILPRLSGGRVLHEIPFQFTNSEDTDPNPSKSPLIDLVNVNISHYRNSADLEHGRHFTALPTAWASGFAIKGNKRLKIGSAEAWVTENPGAKAGFLEFTGAGLGHLQEGMVSKERLMAVLGARLLEEKTAGVEAAETVRLRHSGEQSSLSNISLSVGNSFTRLLQWIVDWTGGDPKDVNVEMNSDFNLIGIDPQTLAALMAAVQGGLLSWNTWFYNVRRGELIPEGITVEDEAALIAVGIPERPPTVAEEEETKKEEEKEEEEDEEKEENEEEGEEEEEGKE